MCVRLVFLWPLTYDPRLGMYLVELVLKDMRCDLIEVASDGTLVNQLLGAYFVVLPLRDEAALSLGTGVLPALFLASLALTMLAAPASSYLLSLPNLPKGKVSLFAGSSFFACVSIALLQPVG